MPGPLSSRFRLTAALSAASVCAVIACSGGSTPGNVVGSDGGADSAAAGDGAAASDAAPSNEPMPEDLDCTHVTRRCAQYVATHSCVADKRACGCQVDADCTFGYHCEPSEGDAGICEPGCRAGDGAARCGPGRTCDTQTNSSGRPRCLDPNDLACPTGPCMTGYQCDSVVAKCIPECNAPTLRSPGTLACEECVVDGDCTSAPTGPRCLTIGVCGCQLDAECGGAHSGKICEALVPDHPGEPVRYECRAGCHAVGNGCPAGSSCVIPQAAIDGHCLP